MISSIQCAMARRALKWGVRDLAREAGVGSATVSRLEAGDNLAKSTLVTIKATFEARGIVFIPAEPGVHEGGIIVGAASGVGVGLATGLATVTGVGGVSVKPE